MQNQNDPFAGNEGLLVVVLAFICAILCVAIVIQVMFLLTLSRCLGLCHERNRTLEPGLVWLSLIPCFNLYWTFVVVERIAGSLKNEYYDRNLRSNDPKFATNIGQTYAILNLIVIPISVAGSVTGPPLSTVISLISNLISLASLVFFIVYWVKIAGFNRQLREDNQYDDWQRDDGYADDDYDRDDRDDR
jgi:hypothetical protein